LFASERAGRFVPWAVMLTRRDALQHLLRLGLLTPADVVAQDITASEYIGRNHLVRVERRDAPCFIVKQPRDANTPDAATMWTEAAIFWLSVNNAEFAVLAPWMPKYYHYDEPNKLLTIELVAASDSLMAKQMAGATIDPRLLRDVGRAFAALHGPASQVLRDERTRRLFRTGISWILTLGQPQSPYAPGTQAAQSILAAVLQRPDAVAALAQARFEWRDAHIVHGDAKAANVLILEGGAVRVIDWEIAALGDGLWDVAGIVHSLLIPNPVATPEALVTAQARAQAQIDALWAGYVEASAPPPHLADPRVTLLRLAGARIVQTCLESTQFTNQIYPHLPPMLQMGLELLTQPHVSRERWARAA
jgi:tRNA A-37 threonylcarbamoyl transferase component Bud32